MAAVQWRTNGNVYNVVAVHAAIANRDVDV